MNTIIAVPSDHPGGLNAHPSDHFGRCEAFTLVTVEDNQITDVQILANKGHSGGGCLEPVHFLADKGARVLIAGGMGVRPLSGFLEAEIVVLQNGSARTVGDAVSDMTRGQLQTFILENACGRGGGRH